MKKKPSRPEKKVDLELALRELKTVPILLHTGTFLKIKVAFPVIQTMKEL